MAKANQFLRENSGHEIASLDDPRIYVIDQYIKQILETLSTTRAAGLRQLLAVSGDSPLYACHLLWVAHHKEHPSPFSALMVDRLADDLMLKESYQGSAGKYLQTKAGAQLRSRGLLK